MKPAGPEAGLPARIFIDAQAFRRLKLYIDLCPSEVGGLGTVEPIGPDLLVTDIFLIRQRASNTDTELDPEAVAEHLLHILQEGRDPAALRLWWHSHADGSIFWSDTDEETIASLHIDQLISIVGNKRHEFRCRLDRFSPRRLTFDGIHLLPIHDDSPEDEDRLWKETLVELQEKVTLIRREVSMVPELFFDSSGSVEIVIPFDEQEPPQRH